MTGDPFTVLGFFTESTGHESSGNDPGN